MTRFSKKAKKIFDLIWYKADIEQSKILFKELTIPLDIAFVKIWFAYYYFMFFKTDLALAELKESDEIIRSNPDKLNSFCINWLFFFYYQGSHFARPMISLELTKQYYNKFESIYNDQIDYFDEWEKHFCDGFYFYNKSVYYYMTKKNLEQEIMWGRKTKESLQLLPEDGEFFSRCIGNIHLAFFQRMAGYFGESEKNFQIASQEAERYTSLWQNVALVNLCQLNMQKGDFKKAFEINEKSYNLCKKFNYFPGVYMSLGGKGDFFYEEGKYNEALKSYQESLIYRKQHNDPLEVCIGYLDIFWLYYQNFKLTKEKDNFKKAEEIFLELKKLHDQYSDNKTITNYTKVADARLLKYGNFTKRAKSVLLFEELIKIWPYNFDNVKEYLELLFEDFLLSEDKETIEKIDLLMKKVIELPLSINSINSYVLQQLTLARYQFFIKDDIEIAFKILNDAKEKISPYKIERYNSQIENEIINFKHDRTKWEKADYSIKERIMKSEFQKYIQEALNTKLG